MNFGRKQKNLYKHNSEESSTICQSHHQLFKVAAVLPDLISISRASFTFKQLGEYPRVLEVTCAFWTSTSLEGRISSRLNEIVDKTFSIPTIMDVSFSR